MSEITLTAAEYIETARKAMKYDLLRAQAIKSNFLTDFEKAVFEIQTEEKLAKEEKEA